MSLAKDINSKIFSCTVKFYNNSLSHSLYLILLAVRYYSIYLFDIRFVSSICTTIAAIEPLEEDANTIIKKCKYVSSQKGCKNEKKMCKFWHPKTCKYGKKCKKKNSYTLILAMLSFAWNTFKIKCCWFAHANIMPSNVISSAGLVALNMKQISKSQSVIFWSQILNSCSVD